MVNVGILSSIQYTWITHCSAEVATAFGVSGSWSEAFGSEADEHLMAWHYARAVEQIIRAGKSELALPMYVNAWLEQYPWTPGSYPSGGPQFKMYNMWKLAAPSIDFYAPDIYVEYYRKVCDEYASNGNPLFIPEVRSSEDAAPFYLYAVGKYNAICFAPFGIEDMMAGASAAMSPVDFTALNIMPEAMKTSIKAGQMLSTAYALVGNMEDIIEKAHREGRIYGFLEYHDMGTFLELENFNVRIRYDNANLFAAAFGGVNNQSPHVAGGLLVEFSENEFVVLGTNCSVALEPKHGGKPLDFIRIEEGKYVNGEWVRGRILNGDERMRISLGAFPGMLRFKVYEYNR